MTKMVTAVVQLIASLVFVFSFALAQNNSKTLQLSISSFNRFQHFVTANRNVDSAFDCIRKLSALDDVSLRMLVHDSFAQNFIQYDPSIEEVKEIYQVNKSNRKFNEALLLRIASDTSNILRETIQPIFLLSKIQNAKNDRSKLITLTEEFISTVLVPEQFYKNRSGRYGLMVFQVISKHPQLEVLSKRLFTKIQSNIHGKQFDGVNSSSSRSELDKRTWYRYMYASVNYIEANRSKEINQTEAFLRTASHYSPDLIDENHRSGYFYEMFFLFGKPQESFKDEYLAFLLTSYTKNDKIRDEYVAFLTEDTDKSKALSTLLQMALIEPRYKKQLQKFYIDKKLLDKSFEDFWMDAIDSSAKKGPDFVLKQFDNTVISKKSLRGKWVLIDFWGTWCRPCRKEHPMLQRYYDSVVVKKSGRISLITVACRDTAPNVKKYMNEYNYSFPVTMSDKMIEENYNVQGYPSKILITPKGNYITIPFGVDWMGFIKQYVDI